VPANPPTTTRPAGRGRLSLFPRAQAYGLRPGSAPALPGEPDSAQLEPPSTPSFGRELDHSKVDSTALRDLGRRERNYRWALATADASAATLSLLLSIVLIGGFGLRPEFLLVIPAVVLAAKLQGLYDHDELVMRKSTLDEFPRLLNLATLFALLIWLTRDDVVRGTPSTLLLFALWGLLIAALFTLRVVARALAGRLSSVERCLVVGSPTVYHRIERKLEGEPQVALVARVGLDKVRRNLDELRSLAKTHSIHRIIISTAGGGDPELTMDLVRGAKATGARVSILPDVLAAVGSSVAFDDLGGMPLLGVPRFGLSRSSRVVKRSLDLVGAIVGLAIMTPFMALTALAIKLDSRGPILFRQTRVGRGGAHFEMLKFRTMVDGADTLKPELLARNEASGLFKIADDPRVTRVGRLLRRTSLDEIPQLLNVLHGNMSLVGPRPLVVDEDQCITGLDRRRLHLTPGMTGRWQILGSARIPLSEMVKIDYLYVANWSLWEDIKILVQTLSFVVLRRGL
jgi:exopolysaccharide biosynthesis polyprenyl glycosylphosphotransferase